MNVLPRRAKTMPAVWTASMGLNASVLQDSLGITVRLTWTTARVTLVRMEGLAWTW